MCDKVVSINRVPDKEPDKEPDKDSGFDDIIKKNKENQERIKKERAKHNKGVTRSHRLKKD